MIYILNRKLKLKNEFNNLDECVDYLIINRIAKGKRTEVTNRVVSAMNYKITYYNLIITNEIENAKYYSEVKDVVSKVKIGDVVGDNLYKVLGINRYDSGAVKFELQCCKCGKVKTGDYKSIVRATHCIGCSKNVFELSEDGTYWIGYTKKGEKFYFDGDNEVVEYIKNCTWRKTVHGYIQNSRDEKLHRIVMGVTDRNIFVNHLGSRSLDCRKSNLTISDSLDNSKEKRVSRKNRTGIVGLMIRNKKYVGCIKIDDLSIYSPYKSRDEALIDLLIMQRHYGFRHNTELYYMLDNIDQGRIDEVINNCERQLNKKFNHNIKTTNRIELSEDKTFYWVYDDDSTKEINRFKVSLHSIDKIKNGKWNIAYDISNTYKIYVNGSIIINNKRKTVKLQRYLLGLLDTKYKNWYIHHLNGDSLDNRIENLEIVDEKGVGYKSKGKRYYERNKGEGVFRACFVLGGHKFDETFYSEDKAKSYVDEKIAEFFNSRIHFKNKEELDLYLLHKGGNA